jgi:hypothetical protein
VASAVVMILKQHRSTGMMMTGAIEARRMRWYSISGMLRIHPEGTVTVTNGGRAEVQGQGHLTKEGSVGAAEAGTWDDRGGPQTAIGSVSVTDFVTGGANRTSELQCNNALTDRFRSVTARSPHLTVDTLIWECGVVLPYRTTLFRVRRFCAL